GGGKANLDLFDADFDQQIKKPLFLVRVHRIDQRLISVAQVGGKPARSFFNGAGWPLAIGQINLAKGAIILRWVRMHDYHSYAASIFTQSAKCQLISIFRK